jgi:uncharacterized repeat protein (TIGR01451 family)
MRSSRTKMRWGGLVAAASAAALSVPLSALGPAHAAGPADLSITKAVADLAPPMTFSQTWRDIRGVGSGDEWTRAGLHITSVDKVGEYAVTNTPLADAGEPSLDYTAVSGAIPPGFVLKVDVTGDGVSDGELIGETAYNGVWWLNEPASNVGGDFTYFDSHAPSCAVLTTCGSTGNGKDGRLSDWRAAFPTATVVGFGFGLGSGVPGEGYVTGLHFAGTDHDFVRHYQPTIEAAPGETVEYSLTVANNGGSTASGVVVTDTLPADLTPIPASLEDNGNGCAFAGKTLTCNAGSFPAGSSSKIYFRATLSNTITSEGLPTTTGHNVDVQKQEVFADLPVGKTKTYEVWCPSGYLPTDGGLLVDAVDQGGYYSDIVTLKSRPTAQGGGIKGWVVKVANLGDERGQGKVKVTCLDETIGSSHGHTHDIVYSLVAAGSQAQAAPGAVATRTCPAGYVPVGAWHDVSDGFASVRSQYALGNVAYWVFDYDPGTAFTFGATCLASTTTSSNGHSATLSLTRTNGTVTVGAESRTEGVQQCGQLAHAITGGYQGGDASLLSLGREQRGTNYMFRFYNDDWDQSWSAGIQVQCVGVRTPNERTFYTVTNTAKVTTPTPEGSTADNSSSAVVKIDGAAVTPPGGVGLAGSGTRTVTNGNTKKVGLTLTCASACTFSVKVLKNGVVVAKATKSLPASPNPQFVNVPTTGAGKSLGAGQVTVKVTTSDGTNTSTVTLS